MSAGLCFVYAGIAIVASILYAVLLHDRSAAIWAFAAAAAFAIAGSEIRDAGKK